MQALRYEMRDYFPFRLFLRLATLILLSTAFHAHAMSPAYRQGRAAADNGDYAQAYALFRDAARQGDAWAQFGLGVLCLNGQGVRADAARSTHWFQKAATQGLALAQFNLGNAYLHGRGVEADLGRAAFWWQQAAEQGNANAQGNLGTLFYFDYATEGGKRLGRAWLSIAAANGDPAAKARLAQTTARDGNPLWQLEPERSEVQILTLPPDRFSINLFTARQRRSVAHFLQEEGLSDKVYIYRLLRGETVLYGVLYGIYPNREAAKETITQMRPALRKGRPWAVTLGSIQNGIRTVQTRQLEPVNSLSQPPASQPLPTKEIQQPKQ